MGWNSWLEMEVQNPGPGNSEEKGLVWGGWEPMSREHSAIKMQTDINARLQFCSLSNQLFVRHRGRDQYHLLYMGKLGHRTDQKFIPSYTGSKGQKQKLSTGSVYSGPLRQ